MNTEITERALEWFKSRETSPQTAAHVRDMYREAIDALEKILYHDDDYKARNVWINKASLIEELKKSLGCVTTSGEVILLDCDNRCWNNIIKAIDNSITLTKCEECEFCYYADNRVPDEQGWVCEINGDDVNLNGFCENGVRKKDGKEKHS